MFTLYLHSILITLFFTPIGLILLKNKKAKYDLSFYSSQLIFGIIILSFCSLFINFFLPLNEYLNTLFIIISLFFLIKNKEIYLQKNFFIFLLISSSLILLLINESNTYRPDAGLYHLPYINILNNEKIIFGLSNLHFRFGHISIIQYLSAVSNNLLFGINGIVFAPAIIAVAVIINFTSILLKKIKTSEFDIHFYFLFGIFIFIFYKMNRYSEYGNDAPSHFLLFYLLSQTINLINKLEIKELGNTIVVAGFIFMNKITLSIASIVPILFLNKKNLLKILSIRRTYFIFIFLLFWILKNIIVSGCIIYPLEITCLKNLTWSNLDMVKYVSNENEAWTKNWPDSNKILSHEDYNKKFNWISDWRKNYLPKLIKILVPYLIILIIISIYLNLVSKKKFNTYFTPKKIYLILFLLFFSICIWFLKIPLLRYGQSFLIGFIALIFAISCSNLKITKKKEKLFYAMIIFGIFIFSSKNILRFVKNENNYNNFPWPKYLSHNEENKLVEVEKLIINKKIFYKAPNGLCMYSKPLCSGMEQRFKVEEKKSYLILINLD